MTLNKKLLLSIAIPTWNRANTLDLALNNIFHQAIFFNEEIQIVISNNCSTDTTDIVIKKWLLKYPDINVIYNIQKENVGFYGNFKSCRELSMGKFIWLLSDDDFIQPNTLNKLIEVIRKKSETLSFIYLNTIKGSNFNQNDTSFNNLFLKYNRKLTFISAIIFLNVKQNDGNLSSKFNNSNLYGFALLVDLIRYNKQEAVELSGFFLDCGKAIPKGYNWFDAFVTDISEILEYMKYLNYSIKIINKIEKNLLKRAYFKRYYYLKSFNKLDGSLESYPISKVNKLLYDRYKYNYLFWLLIAPLFIIPSRILRSLFPLINVIRNYLK